MREGLNREMTWRAPHAGRGVPPVFPSAAIQFCLSVRVRSKLALRQTAGMVVSLLRLAGPAWPVPVTLSGACSLANGEWQARKPDVQGGQGRGVDLAVETATSDIRAVPFTSSRDGPSHGSRTNTAG